MLKRTLSTVILWTSLCAILYFFKEDGAVVLVASVAFFAQWECYRMFQGMKYAPYTALGLCCGLLVTLGTFLIWRMDLSFITVEVTLPCALALVCFAPFFQSAKNRNIGSLVSTLAGIIIVPYGLHFFIRLVMLKDLYPESLSGDSVTVLALGLWLIAVAKFSDVGGLLVGKLCGKTKLSPNISPNKTVEGALGGILFSMIVGVGIPALCVQFINRPVFPTFSMDMGDVIRWGIVSAIISAVAICSDLFESLLKRMAKMKDSGSFIPGIGGAFDLVDSLVFAGPVGYFLIQIVLLK